MYEFMWSVENLTKDEVYAYYTSGMAIILPCIPGSQVYVVVETKDGYGIETRTFTRDEIVSNLEMFGEMYFTELGDAERAVEELNTTEKGNES